MEDKSQRFGFLALQRTDKRIQNICAHRWAGQITLPCGSAGLLCYFLFPWSLEKNHICGSAPASAVVCLCKSRPLRFMRIFYWDPQRHLTATEDIYMQCCSCNYLTQSYVMCYVKYSMFPVVGFLTFAVFEGVWRTAFLLFLSSASCSTLFEKVSDMNCYTTAILW